MKGKKNVIIRNIAISKVLAKNGDAIGVRECCSSILVNAVDADLFQRTLVQRLD